MNDHPIQTRPPMPGDGEAATRSMSQKIMLLLAAVALLAGGIAAGYLVAPRLFGDASTAGGSVVEDIYTCPMHPQVEQSGPGTCPICFMDLVPKKGGGGDSGGAEQTDHDDGLVITPRDRVIADVATVEATWRTLTTSVSAPSTIDFNEGSQRVISARVGGRVERLFVRETGSAIAKGAPLLEIYSPELVAAQKEYLVARETARTLSESAGTFHLPDTAARSARGSGILASARRRLAILGLSSAQIDALDKRGEIAYTMTLFSPTSGIVLRRSVIEGAYVDEGASLMEVVDMGVVWAMIDVPQEMTPRLRVGMSVRLSGSALGDERFDAVVDRIYPTADATARTVRLRAPIANRRGMLRVGMYLTAELQIPSVDALAVPVTAVIRTGQRDLVFVEIRKNTFEARTVSVGVRSGDYYQIVDGDLRRGDRVVAQGGYLLDSERQLTAPRSGVAGAGQGAARRGDRRSTDTDQPTTDHRHD